MTDGFLLPELARVRLTSTRSTEVRVAELAERLLPMSASQRNERWSTIIGAFVESKRAAGLEGHEISRIVDPLAQLVAANLVTLETQCRGQGSNVSAPIQFEPNDPIIH